jgi:aerobic carbon-monoxide dehydrogenase medium subunit
MKPASFEYYDPRSIDEALDLLDQLGEDARVLAGGQSLVPLMNFRLARPSSLIDLNRVADLGYLKQARGWLSIGAMTRQADIERAPSVTNAWPMLAEATRHIGHAAIRARGTVGGSVAHADPAAEYPAVMLALDAQMVVRGRGGTRTVPAEDFFVGYLTTALEPGDLLTEIQIPPVPAGSGWAFEEISRRPGDFALVGVAVVVTLTDGVVARARLTFTGVGPTPVRARRAESILIGAQPSAELIQQAADLVPDELQPESDMHASSEYRREVGGVLAARALRRAFETVAPF